MHKLLEMPSFTKAALTTLESIRALEQFHLKHKKNYVDVHCKILLSRRLQLSSKPAKSKLMFSNKSKSDEEANSKGWLGIRSDNLNADTIAHKHGVVLILSEKLLSFSDITI